MRQMNMLMGIIVKNVMPLEGGIFAMLLKWKSENVKNEVFDFRRWASWAYCCK